MAFNNDDILDVDGITHPLLDGKLDDAWDAYCQTLAAKQIEGFDIKQTSYVNIIMFFMSSNQKMNIFRLLYLLHSYDTTYSRPQIAKRLSLSRQFVYDTIGDCEDAGWVFIENRKVIIGIEVVNAWRHFALKWFNINETFNLAQADMRVRTSLLAVKTDDNIRNKI